MQLLSNQTPVRTSALIGQTKYPIGRLSVLWIVGLRPAQYSFISYVRIVTNLSNYTTEDPRHRISTLPRRAST